MNPVSNNSIFCCFKKNKNVEPSVKNEKEINNRIEIKHVGLSAIDKHAMKRNYDMRKDAEKKYTSEKKEWEDKFDLMSKKQLSLESKVKSLTENNLLLQSRNNLLEIHNLELKVKSLTENNLLEKIGGGGHESENKLLMKEIFKFPQVTQLISTFEHKKQNTGYLRQIIDSLQVMFKPNNSTDIQKVLDGYYQNLHSGLKKYLTTITDFYNKNFLNQEECESLITIVKNTLTERANKEMDEGFEDPISYQVIPVENFLVMINGTHISHLDKTVFLDYIASIGVNLQDTTYSDFLRNTLTFKALGEAWFRGDDNKEIPDNCTYQQFLNMISDQSIASKNKVKEFNQGYINNYRNCPDTRAFYYLVVEIILSKQSAAKCDSSKEMMDLMKTAFEKEKSDTDLFTQKYGQLKHLQK